MAFRSASRIRRNPACSQFRVNYCGDLKQDYRDMKDARDSSVVGPELQKLMNAIHSCQLVLQSVKEVLVK